MCVCVCVCVCVRARACVCMGVSQCVCVVGVYKCYFVGYREQLYNIIDGYVPSKLWGTEKKKKEISLTGYIRRRLAEKTH